MLIITRRVDETIEIRAAEGAENVPLGAVFAKGAIQIGLVSVSGNRARLAIDAPPELKIWRCGGPLIRNQETAEKKEPIEP
jgi:sRNA-binding carbon storage regulator CsrA